MGLVLPNSFLLLYLLFNLFKINRAATLAVAAAASIFGRLGITVKYQAYLQNSPRKKGPYNNILYHIPSQRFYSPKGLRLQ